MAKDLTPEHLRCGGSASSCPSVHELEDSDMPGDFGCGPFSSCPSVTVLTPEHLRCAITAACPSVNAAEGNLLIVGKTAPEELVEAVKAAGANVNAGPDETAIVIPVEYFSGLMNGESLRDRALVNEAPSGLHPSGFDHFREAWQPIETAPKDGTRILLWMSSLIKDNVIIGMWAKVEGDERDWEGWRFDHDGRTGPVYDIEDEDQQYFTHWMPLPVERPMVGLLSQLTEEQRAALFAYDGPEYLGPSEEAQSADEVSATSGSAGLTHKEKAREVFRSAIPSELDQFIAGHLDCEAITAAISTALSQAEAAARREERERVLAIITAERKLYGPSGQIVANRIEDAIRKETAPNEDSL